MLLFLLSHLFLLQPEVHAQARLEPVQKPISVYGFVTLSGNKATVETSDRIYHLDRAAFLKENKLSEKSETRASPYKIENSALIKVQNKKVVDQR